MIYYRVELFVVYGSSSVGIEPVTRVQRPNSTQWFPPCCCLQRQFSSERGRLLPDDEATSQTVHPAVQRSTEELAQRIASPSSYLHDQWLGSGVRRSHSYGHFGQPVAKLFRFHRLRSQETVVLVGPKTFHPDDPSFRCQGGRITWPGDSAGWVSQAATLDAQQRVRGR